MIGCREMSGFEPEWTIELTEGGLQVSRRPSRPSEVRIHRSAREAVLHHGEYDDPAKMTHSRIDFVSRGPNFLQAKQIRHHYNGSSQRW